MAKAKSKKKPQTEVLSVTVPVRRLPDDTMMNLHHELGSGEFDGVKVRFCQCISGTPFWLSVADTNQPNHWELYQVDTAELMNAVLNTVMQNRIAAT